MSTRPPFTSQTFLAALAFTKAVSEYAVTKQCGNAVDLAVGELKKLACQIGSECGIATPEGAQHFAFEKFHKALADMINVVAMIEKNQYDATLFNSVIPAFVRACRICPEDVVRTDAPKTHIGTGS